MPEFVINIGDGSAWFDGLDDFTRGYVEAMFFTTSHGENGEKELNETHSVGNISPELRERIVTDCRNFQADNAADIEAGFIPNPRHPEVNAYWRAGTDFWYNRNGHGVGFWESDRWYAVQGARLDRAAKAFREMDIYPGDDGLIYA